MFSSSGGSVVGEGGNFHAKGATKHGCEGSDNKSKSSIESRPFVDTAKDHESHDKDKERAYFVLRLDELGGSFSNDGADFVDGECFDLFLFVFDHAEAAGCFDFGEVAIVGVGVDERKEGSAEDENDEFCHHFTLPYLNLDNKI